MNKKFSKKEFHSHFVIDQLEQYQQDWFKELMEQKVERLYCTIDSRKDLGIFRCTYNIYLHQNVYQVVVTPTKIEMARHLYKNVRRTNNNVITYQVVRKQQIVNDPSVLTEIGNMFELHPTR